MKIFFMATKIKHNHFSKLLLALMTLAIVGIYSCNDTASKEEKKDTAAMSADTSMKMKADTTKVDSVKTDTSGRGTQPPPPPKH